METKLPFERLIWFSFEWSQQQVSSITIYILIHINWSYIPAFYEAECKTVLGLCHQYKLINEKNEIIMHHYYYQVLMKLYTVIQYEDKHEMFN